MVSSSELVLGHRTSSCSDPSWKTVVHYGIGDLWNSCLEWACAILCCSVLGSAARTAWPSGLCCTALISWVHDKLCQLIFTEEPASSSHLAPAITLPACPCLYLEEKQHVLMATSFGLTVEVTNGIVYS